MDHSLQAQNLRNSVGNRLSHIKSSPHYAQANGFIECMVQTVKMSMKKCLASGQDFNLAMLVYRATLQSNKLPSPAEMLKNRKFRALLPMHSVQTAYQRQADHDQMLMQQARQSAHYNKSARDLPPLYTNQPVYVQQDHYRSQQYSQRYPQTTSHTSTQSRLKMDLNFTTTEGS